MRFSSRVIAFIAITTVALPSAAADRSESEQRAYDLAALSDRSDEGFGASLVETTMEIRDTTGRTAERHLKIKTLERSNTQEGDKTLLVFESPRDIRGTALLSHAQILKPDDQWLYLPALKRVKRISSANKSGPFVGSEFSFEDFSASELNKYAYEYIREEELEGLICDVLKRTPLYKRSGYTRQLVWIDRQDHQIRQVEFYDRSDSLLKILELREYRQYAEIWRPHLLVMTNHQTGKSTNMQFSEFAFGIELREGDFKPGVLSRAR